MYFKSRLDLLVKTIKNIKEIFKLFLFHACGLWASLQNVKVWNVIDSLLLKTIEKTFKKSDAYEPFVFGS